MRKLLIKPNIKIKKALSIMTKEGEKCLIVVSHTNKLLGTLSDGDCRSIILKKLSLDLPITNYFNKKPIYIFDKNLKTKNIKKIFIKNKISLIPVIDKEKVVRKILFFDDVFNDEKIQNKLPKKIEVVIMSGGFGSRLKPFTEILPKALIPVNNKPIIEKIISTFSSFGVKKFYISINFKGSIIKAYFDTIKLKEKIEFIKETKPLGTVGSLSLLKNKIKSTIFVTNCDILINHDYLELLDFHYKNKFDLTIIATNKEYKLPYGNCVINSENNLIKIEEKPKYNFLINSGMYIMEHSILNFIKKNQHLDFDTLIKILKKNDLKVGVFPIKDNSWHDVGEWPEYIKTNESFE
tara:strand:- start:13970 stop:15022 length:1053 start_codon:yes stop_codon:yes gene_type:complete